MGVIDFKEVPSSKGGTAGQDAWAFFARDFFETLQLEIEKGPDRGPDGGRDLIVIEKRTGYLGAGEKRWVVSCKHFVHSDKAVSDSDEVDVIGRVRKFKADAFIAFYSTIPSSALTNTFERVKNEFEVIVYDSAKIESALTSNLSLAEVFKRYFPESWKRWSTAEKKPSNIWDVYSPLQCEECGEDLLASHDYDGIVAAVEKMSDSQGEQGGKVSREIVDIYWACKGNCDRALEQRVRLQGCYTTWEDISDLAIPLIFTRWVIGRMNNIRSGREVYNDKAFDKFKTFTFRIAQLVLRDTSDEQKRRIDSLRDIPFWAGGLGA